MAVLDGEARVLLTAQHIVKALGTTDAMTDDMIQVLSKFDHRFSGMTEKKKLTVDDKKSPEPSTSQKVEDSVPPHQQQQSAPRGARGGRHAKANDFALDAAESVIEQWGMSGDKESRWTFDGPQEESSSCMEAVDEVLKQLESMKIHQNRDPETLERAQNLLQLAMERLVEEFRHMLESCSGSVDPDLLLDSFSAGSFNQALNEIGNLEGSSSNPDAETTSGDDDAENDDDNDDDVSKSRPLGEPQLTVALVPAEVAQGLSDIATRLIAGGYKRECVQVYVSSRKGVLEESLSSLGAERLSIDEVQKMGWPLQEEKIKKWNQAIKVGVRVLFASEKQLCDQIFSASSSDTCFNDIAKGPATQLLNFGEAIAISRRSPEKLFKILDMYDTLQGLLPELDAVFSGISGASVRSEAKELLKRLGEAARGNFAEFENAIQRDGSKIPVPGGAVHPLTRYVMNYIKLLCDYAPTLKLVFGDKETSGMSGKDGVPHSSDDRREPREELSPLAGELNRLTQALQTNLEVKAKIYQDPALTHLFLMNNVHYIVQKVKTSEVRSLVGDIWVRRQTSLVRQYATGYQRAAWSKVLSYLRGEGIQTAGTANGVSRVVLKERFKNFNSVFDEVHKAQSQWVVIDPQLRDELQIFIADKLLPAYRAFLGRYGHYIENGRHPDKYIKYTVEDLEIAIGDFFTGNSGSMSSSRRRSFSLHST